MHFIFRHALYRHYTILGDFTVEIEGTTVLAKGQLQISLVCNVP